MDFCVTLYPIVNLTSPAGCTLCISILCIRKNRVHVILFLQVNSVFFI